MGIEPGSVDQHIKAAMRILGVGDRRRRPGSSPRTRPRGHPPWHTNRRPCVATRSVQFRAADRERLAAARTGRRIDAGGAGLLPGRHAGRGPTFPFPIGTSKPSDLNWATRLVWIAVIAIGVALAFGALVSAIEALSRLTQGDGTAF